MRLIFGVIAALALGQMAQADTPAANGSVRDAALVRMGQGGHGFFVGQMGGAYIAPDLVDYVTTVTRRITQVSAQADEEWHVTILNTAEINAYARPGGYLYITRGMLAILADEDELAAIMAHEVVHVAEQQFRASREAEAELSDGSLLGDILTNWLTPDAEREDIVVDREARRAEFMEFSRGQEMTADTHAIDLLRAAGYDPTAMTDALAALTDWAEWEAETYGYYFNPGEAGYMDDHPAYSDRIGITRSLGFAALLDAARPKRNRDAYLTAIDRLPFGPSTANMVQDHQQLYLRNIGLALAFPPGYVVRHGRDSALILGPERLRLRIDVQPAPAGRLVDYITQDWLESLHAAHLGRDIQQGETSPRVFGGYDGAISHFSTLSDRGQISVIHAAVLRHNGYALRVQIEAPQQRSFLTTAPAEPALLAAVLDAAQPVPADVARRLGGLHLRVLDAKPSDTVEQLMAPAADYYGADIFARLNRLRPFVVPPVGAPLLTLSR